MRRTLVVGMAVGVSVLVGAAGPLTAQDRVASVLAQVRTALGGEQKLAAVNAISAEGPLRRATGARASDGDRSLLVVRPTKLRRSEESTFFGNTTERVSTFDGTQAWDETNRVARVSVGGDSGGGFHGGGGAPAGGGADHNHEAGEFQNHNHSESDADETKGLLTEEQLNASRLRKMKMELQRWTLALLAESSQPFVDAGHADSPDGPADVLEIKDEAGRAVRYFIDPTSHMPLMVQYQEPRTQAAGAPQLVTVAMHLGDYKKVDGVLLPHRISLSVNGQTTEDWTIDKFKINPSVKADAFQKKAK